MLISLITPEGFASRSMITHASDPCLHQGDLIHRTAGLAVAKTWMRAAGDPCMDAKMHMHGCKDAHAWMQRHGCVQPVTPTASGSRLCCLLPAAQPACAATAAQSACCAATAAQPACAATAAPTACAATATPTACAATAVPTACAATAAQSACCAATAAQTACATTAVQTACAATAAQTACAATAAQIACATNAVQTACAATASNAEAGQDGGAPVGVAGAPPLHARALPAAPSQGRPQRQAEMVRPALCAASWAWLSTPHVICFNACALPAALAQGKPGCPLPTMRPHAHAAPHVGPMNLLDA